MRAVYDAGSAVHAYLLHSGSEGGSFKPCEHTAVLYIQYTAGLYGAQCIFYLMFAGHNEMIIHTLVRKEHIGNIHMEHLHS